MTASGEAIWESGRALLELLGELMGELLGELPGELMRMPPESSRELPGSSLRGSSKTSPGSSPEALSGISQECSGEAACWAPENVRAMFETVVNLGFWFLFDCGGQSSKLSSIFNSLLFLSLRVNLRNCRQFPISLLFLSLGVNLRNCRQFWVPACF